MFLSSTLSFLDSFSIASITVGVFLIVSFEYYKRKRLSYEDKEVIKKLLQTLDVNNFQEIPVRGNIRLKVITILYVLSLRQSFISDHSCVKRLSRRVLVFGTSFSSYN